MKGSVKKLALVVLVFITLGVLLGIASPSNAQSAEFSPLIRDAWVGPTKVYPGDTMTVTAEVSDPSGIEAVSADMGSIETISLSLIEGSIYHGTWQGEWLVHSTRAKQYVTTVTATNRYGWCSTYDIVWRDPQTYERYWNIGAGPYTTTSSSWQDAHTMTFTPNVTGNFLFLSSATLENSSTSPAHTDIQTLYGATVINSVIFTPAIAAEQRTFGSHQVLSLTGDTSYTFKSQFRSDGTNTATLTDCRFTLFAISDYHDATEGGSTTTQESYSTNMAQLTFTPTTAGDYIIIASAEINYSSTAESFQARLYYDTGTADWGEMSRQPTSTSDYEQYYMMKKATLAASPQTFSLQCKRDTGGSGTVTYRRARITAVRLSDIGDLQYTEVPGPLATSSTTYQTIGSVDWNPATYGNYFRFGCRFLNLDRTNKYAYVAVYEDNVQVLERAMQPNATTDYIALWGGIHRFLDDTAHSVDHRYMSSSSAATASVKEIRIFMFSADTLNPFGESTHDNYNDNFNTQGEDTVYVQGCFFEPTTAYHVAYYDNIGTQIASDGVSSDDNGVVNSQWYFPGNTGAAPGTWHAVIYDDSIASPSATYTANDSTSIKECTFTVTQAAIPEFPSAFAAIGVGGMCFGIYWWMRRRTRLGACRPHPYRQ